MGKAADNEKLKLQAAFYNNIATGVVIAGYAVPYFAVMRKIWESPAPESLFAVMMTVLTSEDIWLLSALGLWVLFIAWLLRRATNRIIERVED